MHLLLPPLPHALAPTMTKMENTVSVAKAEQVMAASRSSGQVIST